MTFAHACALNLALGLFFFHYYLKVDNEAVYSIHMAQLGKTVGYPCAVHRRVGQVPDPLLLSKYMYLWNERWSWPLFFVCPSCPSPLRPLPSDFSRSPDELFYAALDFNISGGSYFTRALEKTHELMISHFPLLSFALGIV